VLSAAAADDASDDLRDKARRCLAAVLGVCTHVPALEALLPACPNPLALIVLRQFARTLARDADARKAFLASGGLKMVQAFDPALAALVGPARAPAPGMTPAFLAAARTGAADGATAELLDAINALYPAEVVQYVRPDYYKTLTKKIVGDLAREQRDGGERARRAAEREAREARGGGGDAGGDGGDVAALPAY